MTAQASPTRVCSTDQDDRTLAPRREAPGAPLAGTLWFAGWLFTIGLLRLVWWKALVAVLVWPYFLGIHLR